MLALARSRPLWTLDCWTKNVLLAACLSDDDLAALGLAATPVRGSCSARLGALSALHKSCHAQGDLARRVADLLDLRHAEHVLWVRAHAVDELDEPVSGSPVEHGGLAGRLWALSTDAREEVHRLGRVLTQEALVEALGRFARA